ncbi:MAG: hypothetical protein COA44_08585 [Arcobacter sp.]|nr:MAG: hypothetical protein COA44_08585 [Arcobacter sp.]
MTWEKIASGVTALGVFIAAWQLHETRLLASASFEDSFDKQYRELIYSIPVNVLLSKPIDKNKEDSTRETIYNYLDLCNEQIYQRSKKRISEERWTEWVSGIKDNLERPFFCDVWIEVKESTEDTFSFLERLEKDKYQSDPVNWKNV